MEDTCSDGSCSGLPMDADGDTYVSEPCGGNDCDDSDPLVNPGATEICDNGIDDDCDGAADGQDTDCYECFDPADCDDANPCTDDDCVGGVCYNTNNTDPCDDGDPCTMNDTCSGGSCSGLPLDADADTYVDEACGGTDCDDSDPLVNPGATEICDNGIDDDCDGAVDGQDPDCEVPYLDPPGNVDATDVVIDPSYDPMLNDNLNDRVNIVWDPVPGATYYEVFRADEPDGTYTYWDTVLHPASSYDDMQVETLVIPEAPAGVEVVDPLYIAWEANVRTLLNGFKTFRHYKIKALNDLVESDFSDDDEGRIDYTNAEFFDIFSTLGGIALSKVLFLAGPIGIGDTGNWTLYDECGVGYVNFDLASGNVITFTFMDYTDSLDYDSVYGIDCSGDRLVISNGVIYGDLNFFGGGTLTGTVYLTGDTAAEVYLEIPMSFGEPQDGTADVRYNGEEVAGYVFQM
jgi:hypothetical protein